MKVTRDVIYDLLPSYFAGEVTDDTRALVEEFLRSDPEFARMTARFKALFDSRQAAPAANAGNAVATFSRARTAAQRRTKLAALAVAYALATLFVVVEAESSARIFMAGAFGVTSAICGILWYRIHAQLRIGRG